MFTGNQVVTDAISAEPRSWPAQASALKLAPVLRAGKSAPCAGSVTRSRSGVGNKDATHSLFVAHFADQPMQGHLLAPDALFSICMSYVREDPKAQKCDRPFLIMLVR